MGQHCVSLAFAGFGVSRVYRCAQRSEIKKLLCKLFREIFMSIRLLEHIRDELRGSYAIQNRPELCMSWPVRSEGYIKTLRFHQLGPRVEALTICSHKLGHYADKLRS